MAYQSEKDPRLGPQNGPTPSPTKPAEVLNPAARTFGRENLGANGCGGKVYAGVGEKAHNGPLSEEIAAIAGIDKVAGVRSGLQPGSVSDGVVPTVGGMPAPQTRSVSPASYPIAHGVARVSTRPETVPSKIGGTK